MQVPQNHLSPFDYGVGVRQRYLPFPYGLNLTTLKFYASLECVLDCVFVARFAVPRDKNKFLLRLVHDPTIGGNRLVRNQKARTARSGSWLGDMARGTMIQGSILVGACRYISKRYSSVQQRSDARKLV